LEKSGAARHPRDAEAAGLALAMSIESALSILGPALTTLGAGLLAYDVLQGPIRLSRRQDRTDQLVEAKQDHDATARDLAHTKAEGTTGVHKLEVAANEASFASTVGEVHRDYEAAAVRDGARAFRLAIWGLVLVMLGGIAETIAAILIAGR
jgi:hypothetical protein